MNSFIHIQNHQPHNQQKNAYIRENVSDFYVRIDFLVTICSFEGFKRLLLS